MAGALVQATSAERDSGSGALAAPSITITAGNLIVVVVTYSTGGGRTSVAVTDSKSNIYHYIASNFDSGAGQDISVFYAYNAAAGATVVSATPVSAPNFLGIGVEEYSGIIGTNDPLDYTDLTKTGTASTTTDAVISDTITPNYDNTMLHSVYSEPATWNGANHGTGWTDAQTSAASGFYRSEYLNQGSKAAINATWTSLVAGSGYLATIVAFKTSVPAGNVVGTSGTPTNNGNSTFQIQPTHADRIWLPTDTTAMSTQQGWVALRIKMGIASTTTNPEFSLGAFCWGDDINNAIGVFWRYSGAAWAVGRVVAGAGSLGAWLGDTFAVNDKRTLVFAWTAAGWKFSINGGSFDSNAAAAPGTFISTRLNILSTGGQAVDVNTAAQTDDDQLNSACIWAAMGTGTLTDTDASNINAFGDTDQTTLSAFPGSCVAIWNAADLTYIGPSPISIAWVGAAG